MYLKLVADGSYFGTLAQLMSIDSGSADIVDLAPFRESPVL